MNIKKYLIDKIYLIIFFVVLMIFVSLMVYLDGTVKVQLANIIYMNFVSLFLFIFYLFIDFFKRKRYYNALNYIIENVNEDIVSALPEARNNEEKIYNNLFKKLFEEEAIKIHRLNNDRRENSEFITSWVHEIKTPIAVTRLIIEDSMDKSKEEILDSIEDEINKIDGYVEQALYYSKIDDFSKDYFIQEINLDKSIKEIIKKHAKTFIGKKIKVEIGEINIEVLTDKKWIDYIIDQILSNALKYTNVSGSIKIYTTEDKKEKRLIILDNGNGIKKEDINRVFEKGFTGHNGRENVKSTGMGLYLSDKLAKKLGHYISIESKFYEYTKVIIHFPKLTNYYRVYKK
ncbi:sensor histidine kinase [Clostridium rectalis]|uniref:sensor histidine kinase n=1 Tax=Clostridium rectalis TaxID=2040295 RepID=UPI0019D06EA4|nr:sensor histidine kinase [Clostridium rectalis]